MKKARKGVKETKKKEAGEKKVDAAKRKAAEGIIEDVAHNVRIRVALENHKMEWPEFNRIVQGDAELKLAYAAARTTIEDLWKTELKEQLYEMGMGKVPTQATTAKGEVVSLYQPNVNALIRFIDQFFPKPKPPEADGDAGALSAFQAALKLHSEVIGKKGKAEAK